jgi:hypothetical protein
MLTLNSQLIKAYLFLSDPIQRAAYNIAFFGAQSVKSDTKNVVVADAQSVESETTNAVVADAQSIESVTMDADVSDAQSAESDSTARIVQLVEADDSSDTDVEEITVDRTAMIGNPSTLRLRMGGDYTHESVMADGDAIMQTLRRAAEARRYANAIARATIAEFDDGIGPRYKQSTADLIQEAIQLTGLASMGFTLDTEILDRFDEAKMELHKKIIKERARKRMFMKSLKKETNLIKQRKAKEEKAAKEREDKEAAREARTQAKAEACIQKDRDDRERLDAGRKQQDQIWADIKADTPGAKKKSCTHAHAGVWPKQKLNRKFKCEACSVKRGMISFTCPYCDMAVCQMCLGRITSKNKNDKA